MLRLCHRKLGTLADRIRAVSASPSFDKVSVLAKEAMETPQGVQALALLVPLIQKVKTRRFDERKIVACIVHASLQGVPDLIRSGDVDSLKGIIRHASDNQFLEFLVALNDYMTNLHEKKRDDLPVSLVHTIPEIEDRIVRAQLSADAVPIVVNTIGRLKLANLAVFRVVVAEILKPAELNRGITPAIALKLVREMGWAGCMHSDLMERITPLFERFRNYQAMTSVWMLGGGLDPRIVEYSMKAIRRDFEKRTDSSHAHAITVDGHCGIIRRLVACGFFKEAMELFSHFPPDAYTGMSSGNAVSQIQRLFLSSFLDPVTVPPEHVAFLKPDSVKHELTFSTTREQSSYIHTLAVNALVGLNVPHVSELVDEPTQLVVDIYVEQKNLAIEVQGPSHYITDLKTGTLRLRPEDEFKINVLKARGYQVAILSIHDFGRNNATRNAENAIRGLLDQFPDHPDHLMDA